MVALGEEGDSVKAGLTRKLKRWVVYGTKTKVDYLGCEREHTFNPEAFESTDFVKVNAIYRMLSRTTRHNRPWAFNETRRVWSGYLLFYGKKETVRVESFELEVEREADMLEELQGDAISLALSF